MGLLKVLTYNELNGEEVKHVISNRVEQFLNTVTYFQRHLTLPRVRITTQIRLEVWAEQPNPELIPLNDKFEVVVTHEDEPDVITGEAVDSTSPADGDPPDEVREQHGLPVSQPGRGPRNIGGQISIADQFSALEGREVSAMPGLKVSRTGSGVIDGMPTSTNAIVAKIDQGPAGLRMGGMNRDAWRFGGKK